MKNALILSTDGLTILNIIVVAAEADPATFGAIAAPSYAVGIGYTLADGEWAPPAVTPAALTPAQLLEYASDAQNNALAQVFTFNVAASGSPHCVTTKLDRAGSASITKIGLGVVMNAATSPAPVFPYSNVDFTPTTLTMAEAGSLAAQAGTIELSTYALLNALSTEITASPPTITTTAQIDAAAWPVAGTPGA